MQSQVKILADPLYRLCAFSMYTMWWNKPLTPKEPIIAASGDWLPELLAFMYVSSEVSGAVDEKRIRS